ncbi:MAG: double zinc ribbon domain-containing protein [Planctomycetota bacterium]
MPLRVASAVSTLLTATLDVAFPPSCPVCRRSTAERIGPTGELCEDCDSDLVRFDEPVCPRCSTPTPSAEDDCPACRDERWAFDAVVALGPYDGLLRRMVLEGKRLAGEPGIETLGRLLADRYAEVTAWYSEAIVAPVPAHWSRRVLRRADGVVTLARVFAGEAGLPFGRVLRRRRATPRQTEVAPSDRPGNVRGALAVRRPTRVAGRTVLLVDDVFTTGSTCHAAARALKRAGAARVVAVVAARRLGSL